MVVWRNKIYLKVLKNISVWSAGNKWNICQYKRRNSDHVIFFLLYNIFIIEYEVFGDIPKISSHFPKISEHFQR